MFVCRSAFAHADLSKIQRANRAKQAAFALDRLNDKSNNEENIEYPQLPIDFLNNTLQYHLKAENGKVSYRIVNVQSGDPNDSYAISSSRDFPLPFLIPDQSANFQAMNHHSTASKRKVSSSVPTENTKVRDQKRSKHNEIERKRRDKINNWIQRLSNIVPECKEDPNKQPQSKGVILSKVT